MADRSWSLDIKPLFDEPDRYDDGMFYYQFETVLKAIRVAIKSGSREVIVFHAVKPEPPSPIAEENCNFTYKRLVDPDNNPHRLDLNPLAQLIEDANLGRKVREAGLELR